ncbi:MAG: PQQ-binding-like beta-propeller repeat protein, partial [Planctomycetota bacterium]
MRQIALAMAVSCLLSVVACGQATQPVDELEQLKQIRQDLRAELRQRAATGAEIEPPRDVLLEIDDGVGRGRMRVLLRRQGGRWFVRNIDAGSRGPADLQADPSGLSWEDGHIAGPLLLSWQKTTDSGETVRRSQRFNLELQIEQIPRRLVLTFHRFQGGSDWVLAYEPEAEQYVLAEELEIPRQLTGEDPMDREFGTFEPNEKGHFEGRVSMTYAGSHQRLSRSYDGHQPRVTFQGRLIGGRVHGDWTLRAPSGKGLLGTGQDRLSGAIETGRLRGTYRSTGDKGTWKGAVSGARMPVAENPVAWLADEPAPDAPTDLADATARAAELYREIRALDKALRQYPMPVTDALRRTLVPKPAWPEDAEPQAMQTYVDGLVKQARLAAEQKPVDIPTGPLSPDAPAFGPFYGQADLADPNTANHLPAVGDGPQQWRSVMDWQMVGPFPVYDQQASLCHPEVLAAGQPAFHRTRLFTRPDGTVNDVEDTVGWMAARMDGATVAAPARPEASAGAMRYLAWYATTDIQSETEQTVWLAVELQGQGMIWLNDQLVWDSGVDWDSTRPAVFQVHLRKGTNRLLVRCASNPPSNKHCATVDYLNGHTPRPAGRIDFTTFALHVCSQGGPGNAMDQSKVIAAEPNAPRSYRNGGQGIYPDADPPLAWNAETGTNVAWSMDMPYGTGQPVVRDGRLYLTAEPASLICLDVASGETLWRHDLLPVPAPPAEGEEVDRTASATAAPVVTADRVYAQFGHGEVVCYDRNGEEIWRVSATEPWEHPNMGSPVLVEGNLIIQTLSRGGRNMAAFNVMALDAETGETRWTATGSPKRTTTKWDWSAGFGNGLAVMELANGDQQRTLVITGDGGVLDAATGEMLHRDIFALEATRAGPYVDGDTVYIAPVTGEQAVKLWLDPQGRVGARTLWKNPPRWGLGQVKTVRGWGARHWMKGPVVHDGLMYVVRVDSAHVPGHYVCSWTQLEALDVQDGSVVARMRANLRDATDPTIPPAIAGAYVYIGDGGAPVAGFGGETEFGKVAVLE